MGPFVQTKSADQPSVPIFNVFHWCCTATVPSDWWNKRASGAAKIGAPSQAHVLQRVCRNCVAQVDQRKTSRADCHRPKDKTKVLHTRRKLEQLAIDETPMTRNFWTQYCPTHCACDWLGICRTWHDDDTNNILQPAYQQETSAIPFILWARDIHSLVEYTRRDVSIWRRTKSPGKQWHPCWDRPSSSSSSTGVWCQMAYRVVILTHQLATLVSNGDVTIDEKVLF